jgi:uncharacterized protein
MGLVLTYILFISMLFLQSGFDFAAVNERLTRLTEDVNLLRLMQTIQSFCIFILPPFFLIKLYKENATEFLQLRKTKISSLLIGMLSIVFMLPLINVLVEWNAAMHLPKILKEVEVWMRASEDSAETVTKLMLEGTSVMDLIVNLFIVAVLAGVGEEFFFRGLLQSIFVKKYGSKSLAKTGKRSDWSMHAAIWTVAFLFSAIHLQFYGFIPRFLLGAWFGYLLWWTGSIWVPVMAHFTNNALSTIFVYSENKGLITDDPDKWGLNETWWLCLISIILLTVCAYYFKIAGKQVK